MGPVTPLLAVYEAWKKRDSTLEVLWAGTAHGPEKAVIEAQHIPFYSFPVARFPRYITWEWVFAPFRFVAALYKATQLFRFEQIDLVASAGGYTAVPVILAAKIYGVKIWVHQQDAEILFTNRLIAPLADYLTVAWERNKKEFGSKARLVGNPVRSSVLSGSKERALKRFLLDPKKPTVLVFGGGTGAVWLNRLVQDIVPKLVQQANVIHITGKGKNQTGFEHQNYYACEFLDKDMADAYALTDLVVCRAGLGTITELSALAKPAIFIPLPRSAQETNARMVESSSLVLDQTDVTPELLFETILDLLHDKTRLLELGEKLHRVLRTDVADELVDLLSNE